MCNPNLRPEREVPNALRTLATISASFGCRPQAVSHCYVLIRRLFDGSPISTQNSGHARM